VEKLYGSAKFVVFWVLTGIAGVLASYLAVVEPGRPLGLLGRFILKTSDEPSAGASGALFGMVGVLFVFGIKFRHELPEGFKRAFGTGLLPMIMLNLFIGYVGRGLIDNAAHLGGLVSGAALALVVDYRRPGERTGVAIVWRVLQVVGLSVVLVSFLEVAEHFNDPISLPGVTQVTRAERAKTEDFLRYVKAMSNAQEALVDFIHDQNAANLPPAIDELEKLPSVDETADILKTQLRSLLVEARDIAHSLSTETASKELLQRKAVLEKEFASWTEEYNQWLAVRAKNKAPVGEPGQ
jgi:hypothetical protein